MTASANLASAAGSGPPIASSQWVELMKYSMLFEGGGGSILMQSSGRRLWTARSTSRTTWTD